jgi:hypothetical protein
VRPERQRRSERGECVLRRPLPERYWQFADKRPALYSTIEPMERVLVRAQVSEFHMPCFVPNGSVYSHKLVVFAFDDYFHFALLQSNTHEAWIRREAITLRTDFTYTPVRHFQTFPIPPHADELRMQADEIGGKYHEHRRQIMLDRWIGLTDTYNLFHNPACTDQDIARMRELHAEMDRAILACYGWQDLDPGHGFYANERGKVRYTVAPEARRELLRRLLALNLELAEQERGTSPRPSPARGGSAAASGVEG